MLTREILVTKDTKLNIARKSRCLGQHGEQKPNAVKKVKKRVFYNQTLFCREHESDQVVSVALPNNLSIRFFAKLLDSTKSLFYIPLLTADL